MLCGAVSFRLPSSPSAGKRSESEYTPASMPVVPIVTVSQKAYGVFCKEGQSAEDRWKLFKKASSFKSIENNARLVIFHELFFRVYTLCMETQVSYETATAVNNLFHDEVSRLVEGPESSIDTKAEAAGRCKDVMSQLLAAGEAKMEDCVKFHQLFMDEFLSMYDALLYVLTEPNEKVDMQFAVDVRTPSVPAPTPQQL